MKVLILIGKVIFGIVFLGLIYILTLFFPQPFFKNKLTVGEVTVYSDEDIPTIKMTEILTTAQERVRKSVIYKKGVKQNIFVANNIWRWRYFSNRLSQVGGLNYVILTHPIFLRKVDIENNRLDGNSGKVAAGDRTLDYFIAHEMTHTLEFQSMDWYKYPFQTNWVLEGYCDYVAHDSKSHEEYLDHYINVAENTGAKYYSRARTMVAYLLENEKINISDIWNKTNDYDSILKLAIPNDKPNIVN